MTNVINYFDERTGDLYVVQVTPSGDFAHALRYVDRVGREVVVYEHLTELPSYVRVAIEHELTKK